MELNTCGGIAGAFSSIFTNPIDVIKTRIMTDNSSKNLTRRIYEVVVKINSTDKRQYLAGIHWRTLYITVGGFCFFGTNEFFKRKLNFI